MIYCNTLIVRIPYTLYCWITLHTAGSPLRIVLSNAIIFIALPSNLQQLQNSKTLCRAFCSRHVHNTPRRLRIHFFKINEMFSDFKRYPFVFLGKSIDVLSSTHIIWWYPVDLEFQDISANAQTAGIAHIIHMIHCSSVLVLLLLLIRFYFLYNARELIIRGSDRHFSFCHSCEYVWRW